jgi:hypothetical protein
MDQFRGVTILLMSAVHYAGRFAWGVNPRPLLGHLSYYFSVDDLRAGSTARVAADLSAPVTPSERLRQAPDDHFG